MQEEVREFRKLFEEWCARGAAAVRQAARDEDAAPILQLIRSGTSTSILTASVDPNDVGSGEGRIASGIEEQHPLCTPTPTHTGGAADGATASGRSQDAGVDEEVSSSKVVPEAMLLPADVLEMMLMSVGLQLKERQRHRLAERITQIAGCADGHLPGQASVDFAGFLDLMRWMLDSNFANINLHAERLVDRMWTKSPHGK